MQLSLSPFFCNFYIWCFSNQHQPQIQNHNAGMLDYVSFISDDGVTYHSHRCGAKWGTGTFFFGHRLYYSCYEATHIRWLTSFFNVVAPKPTSPLRHFSSQTLRNQFPGMPTYIYICIPCPKYMEKIKHLPNAIPVSRPNYAAMLTANQMRDLEALK